MKKENIGSTSRSFGRSVLKGLFSVIRFVFLGITRFLGSFLAVAISAVLVVSYVSDSMQDLLGYTRATELTDTMVREELSALSEFATYEFSYTNHVDCTDIPELLGNPVWLTDHWFAFDYHGVIKAGYDLMDIDVVRIDAFSRTVSIHLPKVEILSNEITIDLSSYEDRNNICNPLEPREVLEYLYSRKEPELEIAVERGLYTLAEQNACKLISVVISALGYEVIFI